MTSAKWNRKPKRSLEVPEAELPPSPLAEFEFTRVKPRKKKQKHAGYTLIAAHKLWIFENNKPQGGNNG